MPADVLGRDGVALADTLPNNLRDSVTPHLYAVERISNLHRALLMRHHDQL